MPLRPPIAILAGALVCATLAFGGAAMIAEPVRDGLLADAGTVAARVGGDDVIVDLDGFGGAPTRHAVLRGGDGLDDRIRAMVARAVKAVPGMGGVRWEDAGMLALDADELPLSPTHCEEDVEALLRARTIRFEESSAAMDRPSLTLLDEVSAALRPCLGSIIAVTGHTDSSGPPEANLALSRERALAVRQALVARGIPREGLRAAGMGSSEPVDGLDSADPANRRIEFSVIATRPIAPTPIDTPGPR